MQSRENQPTSPVLPFGAQQAQRSHICARPVVLYEFTPAVVSSRLHLLNVSLLKKPNQQSWWSMGRVGRSKIEEHQNFRKCGGASEAAFRLNITYLELISGFPMVCKKNWIRVGWAWRGRWNQPDCCPRCDFQTTSQNMFWLKWKRLWAPQHDACTPG